MAKSDKTLQKKVKIKCDKKNENKNRFTNIITMRIDFASKNE